MKSKDQELRKVEMRKNKNKKTSEIIRASDVWKNSSELTVTLTTLVQKSVEKETFQAFLLVFPVTYDHIFYQKVVFNDQNR